MLGDDFQLIFVDETTLTLDPPLRACWMKKGQQRRIPATQPGTKQRRHMFGGYNWANDKITWHMAETKNSSQFIYFLEQLLVKDYPTGRIVLVMDNASYHKSQASLAALSLFEPRVRVFWLPKYCPNLNPIERFWRHLKDLACANQLDLGLDNLAGRVAEVLSAQNLPDHVLKMSFLDNII